jgi:hypothetical protein
LNNVWVKLQTEVLVRLLQLEDRTIIIRKDLEAIAEVSEEGLPKMLVETDILFSFPRKNKKLKRKRCSRLLRSVLAHRISKEATETSLGREVVAGTVADGLRYSVIAVAITVT